MSKVNGLNSTNEQEIDNVIQLDPWVRKRKNSTGGSGAPAQPVIPSFIVPVGTIAPGVVTVAPGVIAIASGVTSVVDRPEQVPHVVPAPPSKESVELRQLRLSLIENQKKLQERMQERLKNTQRYSDKLKRGGKPNQMY